MSRWLVTNVPAPLLLVAFVLLIVGGAVLVQRYVRHRIPGLKDGAHNDVLKFTYGVIGFVYAFFVGFVVSAMWGQINTADTNARTEGAAGVQLARDLRVFDQPDADRLRQHLLDYARAAQTEWPIVADGHVYPAADDALTRLYTAYEQVQPRTDAQKTLLATSYSNLDKLSQARTERVLQARTGSGPPWSLWLVLFLTTAMVLGCAIIYGVDAPTQHYAMVAVVGVLVAANMFLVVQLAHPYVGEVGVSSDPLSQIVRVLSSQPT